MFFGHVASLFEHDIIVLARNTAVHCYTLVSKIWDWRQYFSRT